MFTHRGSRLTNSRDVDVDVVYCSDGVAAETVAVAKVVGLTPGARGISSRARSFGSLDPGTDAGPLLGAGPGGG